MYLWTEGKHGCLGLRGKLFRQTQRQRYIWKPVLHGLLLCVQMWDASFVLLPSSLRCWDHSRETWQCNLQLRNADCFWDRWGSGIVLAGEWWQLFFSLFQNEFIIHISFLMFVSSVFMLCWWSSVAKWITAPPVKDNVSLQSRVYLQRLTVLNANKFGIKQLHYSRNCKGMWAWH